MVGWGGWACEGVGVTGWFSDLKGNDAEKKCVVEAVRMIRRFRMSRQLR